MPTPTPTVIIARILRGLGLTQGRGCDFRVTGDYRNGELIGTYVLTLTRHADEVIAEHADEIERLSAETGNSFRVSVRYGTSGRPMTTVANYGSRVRETPPTATVEPAPAPTPEPEPAPTPQPQPAPAPEPAPAASTAARLHEGARERALGRQRARALDWSAGQAYLVATAAAGALRYDRHGTLRDHPRPGAAGQAVDEARTVPLVKAGFLVASEPYASGGRRLSATADGREALALWRKYRPVPTVKDRKEDREPLRPLTGGRLAARRALAAAEDQRMREAERVVFYAGMEEVHAWEDRDERLYKAWATVQGITHRLGRPLPAGWVPTEEEIAEHRLDPAVVAELRAEAARPTPKPQPTRLSSLRPLQVAPLPAEPDDTEQLSLFAEAA